MSVEIIPGDWIEVLRGIPDESFQMCVTSPPYYGLRSYLTKDHPLKPFELGAEKTPDEYVAKLVEGFREVRRVLRSDGVLWLNLGDSYAGSTSGSPQSGMKALADLCSPRSKPRVTHAYQDRTDIYSKRTRVEGLKPKDLIGIPWLVAFALRADGWYLRSACPWVKRAAMPESVTDRPGSACEMIFLLSKSDRYFYDSEAVKMPGRCPAGTRGAKGSAERSSTEGVNSRPPEYKIYDGKRNRRNSDWFWDTWQGLVSNEEGDPLAFVVNPKPYKEAHFAAFAPKLITPMILSGTSAKGCCMNCAAPWMRVVEKQQITREEVYEGSKFNGSDPNFSHTRIQKMVVAGRALGLPHDNPQLPSVTVGWKPTCECGCEMPVPCRVLDPFGGSGTVGEVCNTLNRDCTLIDLNPDYVPLMQARAASRQLKKLDDAQGKVGE